MNLKIAYIVCCIVTTVFSPLSEGRILNCCDLAREMSRLGVAKSELATWCCIAQFESRYNTTAIGRLNGNWSNDYGLFQFSDRYWCQSSAKPSRSSANLCQINCQHLVSGDDVRESIKCAQKVKKLQGWRAWSVYNGRCKNAKLLPSIEECF
uniref:Glycosyl hydrolases family 22 (GH22) domain-containing protein n=1 Tax=Musca domestica TaxID=7370 RepID=A0A1I8MG56_MUSDO